MTTIDFCRKHIVFNKSSAITGPFRDENYPNLRKPFAAFDDITCKRLVLLKASSAMGTIALQCMMAKNIVCDVGDSLFTAQSDDDAALFSKTRGKQWIQAIPNAMRLLSRDKYALTQDLWQFRHKFLAITGPGITSAQSVQVAALFTDESHLDTFEPGRLVEFEKRLGGRWCRKAVHVTTAADVGKEVTDFYLEGQQDGWNFRCPKCNVLVEPLWRDDVEKKYNGEIPFKFRDDLDTISFVCPFCSAEYQDIDRDRLALNRDGDYVAANPNAPAYTRSFRWPVWAMHSITWKEMLTEYRLAVVAAREAGNLKPHEDWMKKRLCRPYKAALPDFGDERGKNDYRLGDVWQVEGETVKIMTMDFQAGKGSEGAHLWVLVTQWDSAGNSRRLAWRKVETFSTAEEIQAEFGVESRNVYCDSGHDNRRVFRECGQRHWYATRGSDADEIRQTVTHVKQGNGWIRLEKPIHHMMPFSLPEPQSGIVGEKSPDRLRGVGRGKLPFGWAYCIVMANPALYGYLAALLGGSSGRYFGIASDFPETYTANMPAFIQVITKDKQGRDKATWKKIREDHPHDCEVQALVGAVRAGYFPLANKTTP